MQLHVFADPQQGATYEQQLSTALAAERLGFHGFFRSDHCLAMGGEAGLPGPTDAWMTLAGLAVQTRRIRLGTLMTAATFRLPGPLAIGVAQVDQMSGGRVEFGFGPGGYEPEHRAYGIPLPGLRERFDKFEEQLAVITGLWETPDGESFTYRGRHHTLIDSPGLPKPVQRPRPPVIIGGRGPRRTPALAARYAAEFNCPFPDPGELPTLRERLAAACEKIGRDASSLAISALVVLACGRNDADVRRRARPGGLRTSRVIQHGLVGSPARVTDRIGELAAAGVSRLYLTMPRQFDTDHLEFFAGQVMPQVAGSAPDRARGLRQ